MKKRSTSRFAAWVILLPLLMIFGCRQAGNGRSDTTPDRSGQPDADETGFVRIFDGETLNGWEGDTSYWKVENGCLVGEVTPGTILHRNSFIIWRGGSPADFELKLDFRISEHGNSGINYRSEPVDTLPFALRGYQADIDGGNRYTGQNYEERKRTTLAYHGQKVVVHSQKNPDDPGSLQANVERNAWQNVDIVGSLGNPDSLNTHIHAGDWNECHIIADGNRMQHYINGVLMSVVTDDDSINRSFSGLIGVQVHVGPPMKVEYRNIRLKELD